MSDQIVGANARANSAELDETNYYEKFIKY